MAEDAYYVHREELRSVRNELLSRVAEARAEMNGEMARLSAEVRGSTADSARDVRELRSLVEPLIPRLQQVETKEEREEWTKQLLATLGRRVVFTVTLICTLVGAITAFVALL